ncbi:TPA: hypothetical protein SAN82_004669 [Pseudomonas putida]|nr:hypothetical protein [Pseudomonas putida]
MFKTADVHFLRRIFSALLMVSLILLLGACTYVPADHGEPKRWVVENVSGKSTAELYADLIAPAVFERSDTKVINGYTIESGNLRMPDKSDGALVTVRSAEGSLTAFINKEGRRGALYVDSKGAARFNPTPYVDSNVDDQIMNPDEKIATTPVDSTNSEPKIVDVLMGYSKAGVDRMGGDVTADALAKVEYVNLVLRNSLVSNVSLRLVGIQIVEEEYPITTETLGKVPTIFALGISKFEPDIVYGNFATIVGAAIGWGYTGGRLAIGVSSDYNTFAHEVGHNAGSSHCNDNGVDNYRFGYFNGKTRSILCHGGAAPYYSTPLVKDEFDLPRGNAVTADTARVWRENAVRLSSYATFVPKAPTNFRSTNNSTRSISFAWELSPRASKYEIWRLLEKVGESSTTAFTLQNPERGLRRYHVVAIFEDGTKSAVSNYVWAKPLD